MRGKSEINKKYEIELRKKYEFDDEKSVAKWVINPHNESNLEKGKILNYQGYLFDIQINEDKKINIYEVTHKKFIPIQVQGYYPIYVGNDNKSNLDR